MKQSEKEAFDRWASRNCSPPMPSSETFYGKIWSAALEWKATQDANRIEAAWAEGFGVGGVEIGRRPILTCWMESKTRAALLDEEKGA